MYIQSSEATTDIERALSLTTGKKTRARALALCQRGVLLRKQGADDDARAAFTEAAKLGSSFAKKQVNCPFRFLLSSNFETYAASARDTISETWFVLELTYLTIGRVNPPLC